MRYMIIVKATKDSEAGVLPPQHLLEQMAAYHGELAKAGNTFVVPANLADITSVIALAKGIGARSDGAAPRA